MICTHYRCHEQVSGEAPEAIAKGWRVWYSDHDKVGDRALKSGEVLCPKHVNEPWPPDPATERTVKP